jgi:hypothetical protein
VLLPPYLSAVDMGAGAFVTLTVRVRRGAMVRQILPHIYARSCTQRVSDPEASSVRSTDVEGAHRGRAVLGLWWWWANHRRHRTQVKHRIPNKNTNADARRHTHTNTHTHTHTVSHTYTHTQAGTRAHRHHLRTHCCDQQSATAGLHNESSRSEWSREPTTPTM